MQPSHVKHIKSPKTKRRCFDHKRHINPQYMPSHGAQGLDYQSQHHPYSNAITVDTHDDHLHLPLHHMESTEARLRRAHNAPSPNMGGWTQSSNYTNSPGRPSGYPSFAMDDAKGVYEKERIGYATGRLPPRQSKTPVSLVSALSF